MNFQFWKTRTYSVYFPFPYRGITLDFYPYIIRTNFLKNWPVPVPVLVSKYRNQSVPVNTFFNFTRHAYHFRSRTWVRERNIYGFRPCTPEYELNTKNSTKQQQSCRLGEFLVFNSAFGRYRHWLVLITKPSSSSGWSWSNWLYKSVPTSAEGRVEHQKLNQTTALLLFGWIFGVQLDSLESVISVTDRTLSHH